MSKPSNWIDALHDIEGDVNELVAGETTSGGSTNRTFGSNRAGKVVGSSPVAAAIEYMLKRCGCFTSFRDHGRTCLTNNAAEHALCDFALDWKFWLFAESDRVQIVPLHDQGVQVSWCSVPTVPALD